MLYHESERVSYNSQTILEFYGEFHRELFEKSMIRLVEETPILRSFIKRGIVRPQRYMYSECPFKKEQLVEYSSRSDQSLIDEFCMRGFNLEKGPMIRALVVHLSSGHHKLVLNIHHTLGDGFAQMVLLEDLLALMSSGEVDRKVREVPPFLWRKALYQLKGAKWFLGKIAAFFRPFRKERSYKMATLVTNHELTKRKVKSKTIKISAEFEGLFNQLRKERNLSHIELLTFIAMKALDRTLVHLGDDKLPLMIYIPKSMRSYFKIRRSFQNILSTIYIASSREGVKTGKVIEKIKRNINGHNLEAATKFIFSSLLPCSLYPAFLLRQKFEDMDLDPRVQSASLLLSYGRVPHFRSIPEGWNGLYLSARGTMLKSPGVGLIYTGFRGAETMTFEYLEGLVTEETLSYFISSFFVCALELAQSSSDHEYTESMIDETLASI